MGVQETSMSGSALHLTGCRTSGKSLPWLGLTFLYCEMKTSPRSMISQTVFLWAPGSEEVILGTKAVVSGKWKEFQFFKHSSAMRSYILNFSLWLCWKKDFDSKINKMETTSLDDFKQHFPVSLPSVSKFPRKVPWNKLNSLSSLSIWKWGDPSISPIHKVLVKIDGREVLTTVPGTQ